MPCCWPNLFLFKRHLFPGSKVWLIKVSWLQKKSFYILRSVLFHPPCRLHAGPKRRETRRGEERVRKKSLVCRKEMEKRRRRRHSRGQRWLSECPCRKKVISISVPAFSRASDATAATERRKGRFFCLGHFCSKSTPSDQVYALFVGTFFNVHESR